MSTRLTCIGSGIWRPLIAMGSACLLSACASFVLPGQSPQTPEQLVALVKRIADSGRLNDPESVASMLGTTLTPNHHRTYGSRGCEFEATVYDVPRNYLRWDWLAEHPILSVGRPIEPEPFRPRITMYDLTVKKACDGKPSQTEASLEFSNIDHWNEVSKEKLTGILGLPKAVSVVIDSTELQFYYDSINQRNVFIVFGIKRNGPVYRILLQQSEDAHKVFQPQVP